MLKKVIKEYGGFEEVIQLVGEEPLESFCDKIYSGFCEEYRQADYIKNVKWLLRHFYASKKVALSALFFTQTEELNEKNLKNLTFYTCYYSLFNALISNLVLTPYIDIDKIKKVSHSQVFTDIKNYFIKYGIYGDELINLLNDLRLARELYSYHLPLGGGITREGKPLNADALFDRLTAFLTPILQISNLMSFMSYYAWKKKVGRGIDEYEKYRYEIDTLFFSFIEIHDHMGNHCVIDDDDYSRQAHVLTNWTEPFPISWFVVDRICEDLGCGWEQKEFDHEFDIDRVEIYLGEALQ